MSVDIWELSRGSHPRTKQLRGHLVAVDFAARFDALSCTQVVAASVPLEIQREAVAMLPREMSWSETMNRFMWREAWRPHARLSRFTAIGLDIRIDRRVEFELLFATPEGHLSGPFARFAKQTHRTRHLGHTPAASAPCLVTADDLAHILEVGLELYDDLASSLESDSWWDLAPKPWIRAGPFEETRLAA